MSSNYKIIILGIGGVGGYIGGKLAEYYLANSNVEIIFIARGENAAAIKSNGLKLIIDGDEKIIHPSLVTSNPSEAGIADLIICCTKSYDLETAIESIRPCVNQETVILPLLNGVDGTERIKKICPDAEVWEGCIYITSQLAGPGIIEQAGANNSIYFGSVTGTFEKLQRVEQILKEAGLNIHLEKNIQQATWKKFIFLSPLATLTTFLDMPIGEIKEDPEKWEMLIQLQQEIISVAKALHIPMEEKIKEKIQNMYMELAPHNTSSMHRDYQKGGKTEIDSITRYVAEQGKSVGIPTPFYSQILKDITL